MSDKEVDNIVKYQYNNNGIDISESNNIENNIQIDNNNEIVNSVSIKETLLKNKYKKYLILIVIIMVMIITLSIGIYFGMRNKNKNNNKNINTHPSNPNSTETGENIIPISKSKKIESEFEFKTEAHDLKRICIGQTVNENIIINKNLSNIFYFRNTCYDIYIISEEESDEGHKNYYDKMYSAVISIVSECISRKDSNCTPDKLIDLTNSDNSTNNSDIDKSENDLKDIPIPICLFNITNNDIITSITCHENLSEHQRKMIVLDLYFFRPPAMKRIEKEKNNITINYINLGDGNKKIRETNGGICDIENAFLSYCTTDMNTTVDQEYNILKYEEVAYMSVVTDENNSYEKNKITKLIDETSKMNSSYNYQKYEETLNQLLPSLKPYFKTYELFSEEKFEELWIVSIEGVNKLNEKLRAKRKLTEGENVIIAESELLNYMTQDGVNLYLQLSNNAGKNSENSEANANLQIENYKNNIVSSSQSSLNFNKIINQLIVLSQSGNHLATQLLQKINNTLESMTQDINEEISKLNSLIKYEDFSQIFESIDNLSILPYIFISETGNLKNKLSDLLNNINNGGIKTKLTVLNQNIYSYTTNSHNIINEVLENLKILSNALNSKKSKLTEISTYYLNNTPNSFIGTIEQAENILNNYYKFEYDIVIKKVNSLIKNFKENFKETLEKEANIIDNIYSKLNDNNLKIEKANEDDYKNALNNLYNIKILMNDIIDKIEEKIMKEVNIKDSGYLISNYDINSNNQSSYDIIQSALNISKILDNDEYIDKTFDDIMSNFRKKFTDILKYMDKRKEELFPFNEDVLSESTLTLNDKKEIENTIEDLGVSITNEIRNENENYFNKIQKMINDFINNNKNYLNTLTNDLTVLFSEDSLKELSDLFDKAFNSCLDKVNNELHNQNKLLANQYLNNLDSVVNNRTKIIELLKNYHTDDAHLRKFIDIPKHRQWLQNFSDYITGEQMTTGYQKKYETFKLSFDKSKNYINTQFFKELLLEYKKSMNQIKEVLQTFKSNKLSDKYVDLKELSFIDEDIKKIDNLYNRLNKYISDTIFNNKFVDKFNKYKNNKNAEIPIIIKNIDDINKKIIRPVVVNNKNDFCVTFQRKRTYACENGAFPVYTDSKSFCYSIPNYSNNYLKLVEHTIYSDSNFKNFLNKYTTFYNKIKGKVNSYTSKIQTFKNSLLTLENELISKNSSLTNLTQIEKEIDSILKKKYGEEIIKSSYNYYKSNAEYVLYDLLNDISDKWTESFNILKKEINNNLYNFKASIEEFSTFASIYRALIEQNITTLYFDSIETHQRSEFNYTISYYYNYLMKIVQSTHQYIINKIPTNTIGFNNVLEQRKKQVNNMFNKIIQTILNSEKEALSFEKQINCLNVANTNFFKINNILSNNILTINNTLTQILNDISSIKNYKDNDDISLTTRFYLENKLSGREVEELYEQINKKVFVYLNLEKFKELIINNWIFNQDEFIQTLNLTIYNSKLEIEKEFSTLKEDYSKILEEQITKYFTKDKLENKISNYYNNEVKEMENNQVEAIKQNIVQILNKIKQHISEESIRLNNTLTSYNKDYTQIQKRLNGYKTGIFNKLNSTIFKILDDFRQNMINKVYNNYIVKYLNEYITDSKQFTSIYGEQKFLNFSYKIGEIIDNIIEDHVNDYKEITKFKIDLKYNDHYLKMKEKVNLDNLKTLINNEIDNSYKSTLLPILKELEKSNSDNAGVNAYDFSDTIIANIDSTINSKINNIKEIVNTRKGSDYDINLNNVTNWEILDFSRIGQITDRIKNNFNEFYNSQKTIEENNFDKVVKEIVKSNFDNLLNYIIPSFGNDFFKRVINYNENFKISSLYVNLKYSLTNSLGYYLTLKFLNYNITSLTKDLKIKLLTLNNLDVTVEKRNKEVLDLLELKANEFIVDSKEYIINKYREMLQKDASIQLYFDNEIYSKIETNINSVQNELEKKYTSVLNKYLKEQLITSYTKVMNERTYDMIQYIKNDRELLKSRIDDLFTIEPDVVLNDINVKMNNTLNSIEKYNNILNTFQISEQLFNFLDNYGELNIQPLYKYLLDMINEKSKNLVVLNIEENSQIYENELNENKFISESNKIINKFKNEYIEKMNETINLYGIDDYPSNLEHEINRRNARNRRRLQRILTDEDIQEEYQEKIADKALDNTFRNLLTSSNNTKTFINSFEKFDEFDKLINKYINKVNSGYKSFKKKIIDNDYEVDITNTLNEKLESLYKKSLDYYSKINGSYYNLKNYLKESINEINEELDKCANITYDTFNNKYKEIGDEVESIDKEEKEIYEDSLENSYTYGNQNQIITVNYKIENLTKDTQFKYNLEFEDSGIKKPKVRASIINQNKPKKISFKVSRPLNGCGKIVEAIEVEFNKVNYTMDIDFNTTSTNIYLTTITDFDSYQLSREIYEIEEQEIQISTCINGVYIPIKKTTCNENVKKIVSQKENKIKESKSNVENFVI